MTAREWINILNILESIDEVPGMPDPKAMITHRGFGMSSVVTMSRHDWFLRDPAWFLRTADDGTQAAIWEIVQQRLNAGGRENSQ